MVRALAVALASLRVGFLEDTYSIVYLYRLKSAWMSNQRTEFGYETLFVGSTTRSSFCQDFVFPYL